MRFGWKNDDGTYTMPCVEHPCFSYHALNKKFRDKIRGCSKLFLKNVDTYAGKTVSEIKEMFKENKGGNLMKSLNFWTRTVPGSAGYWRTLQQELKAAILEKDEEFDIQF